MNTPDNTASENAHAPEDDATAAVPGEARTPVFNLHGAIILLSAACIAVHVIRTVFLTGDQDTRFLIATAFFPVRYIPAYFTFDLPTFFSPITYAFVHGDWVHLGINLIWLAAFGSPLAYRIGWRRSLVFWVISAGAAAATHLAIYFGDAVPVIGASGAVSGFMGAAARFGLRANRRYPRRGFDGPLLSIGSTMRARGVLPFLLIWIAMNAAVGLDFFGLSEGQGIAWEAHIGGLVAGFFLVPFFDRRSQARFS
jgi:membrane associated rhomboid family serine protease